MSAPAMIEAQGRGPLLPRMVRTMVQRLPAQPLSRLFANALNVTLRRQLPAELFERHAGRVVVIDVCDAGARFRFQIDRARFSACPAAAAPDLCLRASAYDFTLLAAREEDADTLFFQRRLTVEGDTELALLVKNALDCIEAPRTRQALRRLLGFATTWRR